MLSEICEPICLEKRQTKAGANAQFADPEGLAGPEIFQPIEAARQLDPS
jgi:hypothetical protein